MPHNHPPRCCCWAPEHAPDGQGRCTSCPEHGDLAQLSQPTECPHCHTTNGHPHTDYCQAPKSDPASVPYGTEIGTYRAMGDPVRWVKHWATQTSQPAATTSQPPTHTRAKILIDFDANKDNRCPACGIDCDQPPGDCTAPRNHDHPHPVQPPPTE